MDRNRKDPGGFQGLAQGQVAFSLALGFGIEVAVCVVLGVWADRRFETAPLWTVVGVVVGLLTGGATVVGLSRALGRRPPRDGA